MNTSESQQFSVDPPHQTPGLNIRRPISRTDRAAPAARLSPGLRGLPARIFSRGLPAPVRPFLDRRSSLPPDRWYARFNR